MKFEPTAEGPVPLSLWAHRAEALLALPLAAEGLNEHDFMQHGQELAEQLTGSRIAFIHFVNDDQETIELVNWSRNTLARYCTAAYDNHYPISQAGIWADALRQRAPVVYNDYPNAPGKHGLPEGHARLDRLISVPVIEGGLVRMMAGVGNKPEPYTERDVETVRLIADAIWRIVRQRRADAALRQSEERHRLFADNASDIIWTMDLDGRFTYMSPSVEKLRGYTSAEAIQQPLEQALTAASFLVAKDYLERTVPAMLAGRPFSDFRGELEQTCKDGSTVWIEVTTSGMKNTAGEYFGIQGVARDMTERKRADEALRASEERNRAITQSAFDAIITTDSAGHIAGWNRGAQIIFGYTEQEVMGQPMTLLIPPRFQAGHLAGMDRMASGAAPRILGKTVELSGLRKNSEEFPLELSLAKWESAEGWFVTGIIRDMTQSKANQTQLKLAAQVFAQGHEGITVADAQGHIVMVNQAFTTITGYPGDEVLGKNPNLLSSGRQSPEFYTAMWREIHLHGHWAGEIWNRHKNGTVYPVWLTISVMRDAQGGVTHYIGNLNDLSAMKAAENRIHWLSHFDVRTGLPNRSLLQDRTEHAISMAQRAREPLTMMMVSIDYFNNVNDTLNDKIGDELLLEIAKRLGGAVREQDTVARIGDKEFVLVLPGTPASGAAHLATQLLLKLAQPFRLSDQELALTASIGIASCPDNGADFNALFTSVKVAMHRAQANGRGNFQFYSDALYQQVQAREQMIQALRQAMALDQLQLMYQPLADLQTGHISGMEALLRWQHPELGAVSPVQFIPLAEGAGLIKEIGEWVLRQACRDIRRWLDQGIQVPHVAVNVSPLQFHDHDLIAKVKSALAESQVDAAYLYLEVTESALMDDVPHSEGMLVELKKMGLKLSLDDFGTGYSSLSYLKRFPFDKVKIDQSFVRDIANSQSDHVLVNVIVSMAHGLGLKVIAEGVETEAQCEIMRASVCDEIQGYFFSHPISAQAIEELFKEGRQLPAHLLRLKKPQRTLLLVDDEPNILASLKRLFRRDGHAILTANSGPEGLELLSRHKVDVIISDQRMPGMTGVEFLRIAKVNHPDTIRIVLSGYTELQSVTDAINEGAVYRFLTKPWEDDHLREHVNKAFAYKELLEENKQLDIKIRTSNQELVAANRQLGEVLENKRHEMERDSTSLTIVREVLQQISMPVIGVDDEGLVAFANEVAEQLFASASPLLGHALAVVLPAVHAAVEATPEGVSSELQVANVLYALKWNTMGALSSSRGRIIILNKLERML